MIRAGAFGKLIFQNIVSFLLQEDGASKVILEDGSGFVLLE